MTLGRDTKVFEFVDFILATLKVARNSQQCFNFSWSACATESTTAFVSFRERPVHFDDNQTLSLRVIDPITDGGVWAIIDDGRNSCCHGEVRRQNAEANMKAFGLHLIWSHRKASTFSMV